MDNRHFKKQEIKNFIAEWDRIVRLLKASCVDLSKIKLTVEVN
jgi:hypothetical protein